METISVFPTSRDSAFADEIILRETTTTRLVFRPLIVNNIHDHNASVKGFFVFQRRRCKDEWIDCRDLSLSTLKATEWIKLEIKADELLKLFTNLNELYCLYAQEGIPRQKAQFIKAEAHLAALLTVNDTELSHLLEIEREMGLHMFSRLLTWFVKVSNREQVVSSLETIEPNSLQRLNTLIGLENLRTALSIWNENRNNSDEEFWQQTLSKFSFVLSQVFSFPVVVLKGKAYVGGKGIENTHGNIVDFLVANQLTGNTALVEIKTPKTKIVGPEYRGGIHSISSEVIGAVMQVSNYRDTLMKQFDVLVQESKGDFVAFNPQCLVIAGNTQNEQISCNHKKSFELFRNSLKDVQVITYDELFYKVQILIDLLEENTLSAPTVYQNEDDIPF